VWAVAAEVDKGSLYARTPEPFQLLVAPSFSQVTVEDLERFPVVGPTMVMDMKKLVALWRLKEQTPMPGLQNEQVARVGGGGISYLIITADGLVPGVWFLRDFRRRRGH
jgi:hypothetical protein